MFFVHRAILSFFLKNKCHFHFCPVGVCVCDTAFVFFFLNNFATMFWRIICQVSNIQVHIMESSGRWMGVHWNEWLTVGYTCWCPEKKTKKKHWSSHKNIVCIWMCAGQVKMVVLRYKKQTAMRATRMWFCL